MACLLAGLALALIAFPFFLPKPPDTIRPTTPAVQPSENSTKSRTSDGSAAVVPEDTATEQPHIRPEEKPTASLPATAKTTPEETEQKKSPEAPELHQTPPAQLGSLRIREGDEVLRFLLGIYGNTETTRFQAVIRANPHIVDMNIIQPGETIAFPAIPATAQILATAGHWVQIAKKGNLEEAYRIFKTHPQELLPIRMIPSWTKKEGLAFTIILKKGFSSEEAARNAILNLPPKFAASAEIMKTPERDTVYFTY